jgi:hypothetical protein
MENTITPQDLLTEAGQLYGSESEDYNAAIVELVNRCLGRNSDDLAATADLIRVNQSNQEGKA